MSVASYWSKLAQDRLARRRILAGGLSLSGAAAALSLVGCGGSGNDGGQKQAANRGLLTSLKDRSSEAVPGGRYASTASNIPQVDPIGSPSTLTRIATNLA